MSEPQTARYTERVVLVTGARKGLGRMLVGHFLDQGASVVGASRGESSIDHANYRHFTVDIGDHRAVRAMFLEIGRSHGQVDIVLNNAAVVTSIHAIVMPALRAEEMVRTNFLGGFFVACEAAKLMRKRTFGRIINIGSMHTTLEPIGASVYAATKAATMTLTGVLAKEFASYGITVNTLAVTALETDMLGRLPRATVDAYVTSLPLPRLATPADVFNVVDFFAAPESGYITAQTVFLGGVHG